MKKTKKFLSSVLVLIMCFSVMPMSEFGIEASAAIYENAIFPAPRVYLTQLAYESYSHGNQNAIDISPGGNVFAPFTGEIVYLNTAWGYVVLQSKDKVYYADGTLDYMTVGFMHDSNISNLYKGQTLKQGEDFYQAGGMGNGNPNAYGAHVHINVFKGRVTPASVNGNGNIFAYNAFYVNTTRTTITRPGIVVSGNVVYNGAPTNYNGLWKTTTSNTTSTLSEPNSIIYPTSGATYKIASAVGSDKYLDFSLSTNNVQIYENCDGSSDPTWVKSQYYTLSHVGDGWYSIINIGNGKAVDIAAANPTSGTNIQQCDYNGNNAQLYRFYDAGNGYCYIKSKLGCYVDVENGTNGNNVNVWAYTFNGTNAQKWKLVKKDVPSLTVNFVHHSSSDCADKNVIHGDAYGTLPEPKRPGFVFEGWYTALNGGTKITASTKVTATSNHTLYAHWKTQTVYFDVNHSNINVNLFRTINGKIIDEVAFDTNTQILSFDGSFGSWTTVLDIPFDVSENDWCCITANSLSGKVQDGDCIVFEAVDKDFNSMSYSIGRRIHYDVAHAGNGIYNGAFGIDKSACSIKYIKLFPWSGDGPFYCEDLKLQIKIEKGSTTEYSPAAQVINNGSTYGTLPTPTRTGYTFDGWYTSATGGTKITSSTKVTVTGDQTLYAHWTCNHSATEVRNVKTATCTAAGYTGDTYCKTCGTKTQTGTAISKTSHNSSTTIPTIAATCTKTGLTEGKKCTVCGTITVVQQTVAKKSHVDNNEDYTCDYGCGYAFEKPAPDAPTTPDEPENKPCSCNCHKGGIKAFFFKIINFFEKLFGKNKVCACGVKH